VIFEVDADRRAASRSRRHDAAHAQPCAHPMAAL